MSARRAPPRFEVVAAWSLGVGLPLMETMRRRTDFSDIPAYVDDYIAGALLLIAAWWSRSGDSRGAVLLVAAWGVVCGGAYYSFFGQLRAIGAQDVSGLSGAAVVAIKGALFAVAMVSLALSIRAARHDGAVRR